MRPFRPARQPVRLTLLIPELIWPEPEDGAALDALPCPGLDWLLARGIAGRAPARPGEHVLAAAFGLGVDAPFGALRLLGEPEGGADAHAGFWLCADPVHLRFHHERIILAEAGAFELEDPEAQTLAAALNREFADLGQFHVAHRRRWYLRLNSATDYAAPPLSAVAGRRIAGELPEQTAGSRLRACLNEVQMFLHAHPVNAERERAGKPPVNSLWLWGAGTLPEAAAPGWETVWANDPIAVGLAHAAGIPTRPAPAGLAALLAHGDRGGSQLAVLDDLPAPVLYEDSRAWRDTLLRLEKDWFAPLRAALGGGVEAVRLLAPTVYGELSWQITAGDRWKFWRRPRPLAALARELAT